MVCDACSMNMLSVARPHQLTTIRGEHLSSLAVFPSVTTIFVKLCSHQTLLYPVTWAPTLSVLLACNQMRHIQVRRRCSTQSCLDIFQSYETCPLKRLASCCMDSAPQARLNWRLPMVKRAGQSALEKLPFDEWARACWRSSHVPS